MCAMLGLWGVPDFGAVVDRPRITEAILNLGTRPCVMHALSGSGKSVAAARYSGQLSKRCVWIDAGGEFLNARQIASCVSSAVESSAPGQTGTYQDELQLVDLVDAAALAVASAAPDGVCVIVDDMGPVTSADGFQGFQRLVHRLGQNLSQMVVTTRSLGGWPADVLCECGLLGPADLALTQDEAEAFMELTGQTVPPAEAATLVESCGGHAALRALLHTCS